MPVPLLLIQLFVLAMLGQLLECMYGLTELYSAAPCPWVSLVHCMGHLKDTPQLLLSLCEPGSVKKSTLFGSTLDLVVGWKQDLVVGWKPVDTYTHLLCWVDDPEVPSTWFFLWGWTHLVTALSNSVLHSVLHSLFSFSLFYYFLYINHFSIIFST